MSLARFLKFPVCGQHCGRISVKRYWFTASIIFWNCRETRFDHQHALLLRKDDLMGGFATHMPSRLVYWRNKTRPERLKEILSLVQNGTNIDSYPKTVNSQGYLIINGSQSNCAKIANNPLIWWILILTSVARNAIFSVKIAERLCGMSSYTVVTPDLMSNSPFDS